MKPETDLSINAETKEKISNNIKGCLDMLLGSEALADDHFEISVFRQNPALRESLEERLHLDLIAVIQSANLNGTFRGLIATTIQVAVVNQLLLSGKFADNCELICGSINRGIASSLEDERLLPATQLMQQSEAYPDYTWCYEKALHESAWAEMKLRVLHHLLIHLFEQASEGLPVWWDYYRKAYSMYIGELYEMIVKSGAEHKGFPHPMVVALSNETLLAMYEKLLGTTVTTATN